MKGGKKQTPEDWFEEWGGNGTPEETIEGWETEEMTYREFAKRVWNSDMDPTFEDGLDVWDREMKADYKNGLFDKLIKDIDDKFKDKK